MPKARESNVEFVTRLMKDQTGGIVAYVSYNGRVWGLDGKLLNPEQLRSC